MSQSNPRATPLERLQAQAARRPHAPALRTRRRGGWWAQSWSRLAADALALRSAWSARGLTAGGELLLLGPLSPAGIASLIALPSLGVTVVVAAPGSAAEAAAIARATHVLADGTHEFERVLRHAGPALRHVVVGDDVAADLGAHPASGTSSGGAWTLELLPALLSAAKAGAAPTANAASAPALKAAEGSVRVEHDGVAQTLGIAEPAGVPTIGLDESVLADFEPHWAPGVAFLLGPWLTLAPTLLLPEPGGDPRADRTAWRPAVWLAPPARLDAFVAGWTGRVPARGFGARLVRGLLQDARRVGLAQRLARWRLRRGLAVDRLRLILSDGADGAVSDATVAGLAALALPLPTAAIDTPQPQPGGAPALRHGATAGDGYAPALAGSPT